MTYWEKIAMEKVNEVNRLESENARLREALKINLEWHQASPTVPCTCSNCDRARAALAPQKEGGGAKLTVG